MGIYTEFHFNVELINDIPSDVLKILEYMISRDNDKYDNVDKLQLPDHPFFTNSKRWVWMLHSDSYYFSADTHSTLRQDDSPYNITRYLCIRCNLKNYCNEIENFVDWINPYVKADKGDFLGFSRYEESEDPEIIRKK